jgi:ribosomal-protein-alanine N-acetyltransferase
MAGDPSCAFLAITGSHHDTTPLPDPDVVAEWSERLCAMGFDRVRTNAVAPAMRELLAQDGFTIAQELVLYSLAHWTSSSLPASPSPRAQVAVKRPLRLGGALTPALRREILDLDTDCFGGTWGLDEGLLDDALAATPRSSVFVSRHERGLSGFVIAGLSDDMGYVQRLAVRGDMHRQGIATALVSRALRWVARRGGRHSMVNTEVGNDAARALYVKMGFAPLPARLAVMHKELR